MFCVQIMEDKSDSLNQSMDLLVIGDEEEDTTVQGIHTRFCKIPNFPNVNMLDSCKYSKKKDAESLFFRNCIISSTYKHM